jgi:hypothetical protein
MANRSGLPTWSKTSPKRLAACRARIRDEGVDRILQATERIPQSSFLRGATGNWSGASVEFFLRPDTVTRILEGKYDDRSRPSDDSNGDRRDGFTRAIHHDIAARRSRPAADETRQPDAGDDRDDRERAAPRLTGV